MKQKTKKITFFAYDLFVMGGIERVVTLIANELVKKYEVEIISLYKTAEKPMFNLNPKVKLINILGDTYYPFRRSYFFLRKKIKNFLKEYSTDYFVCAGMKFVGLTSFMHKKCKYIAWEHANTAITKDFTPTWLGRVLAAKYAEKIVVLTQKDMKLNIEKFKTQDKIVQIYNPSELTPIKKEYKKDVKKILSCGRISHQKGFDMLVEVAEKVFEKHPDWEWHLYGDGNEREKLEELIKEKNVGNNLKLMGKTNRMNELYNEYAMFVMTSRYEGFAMVNIEAHYAKLPIVSFNCNCGPDEIIQDGINGCLVNCFDIDMMAEKINMLIENPELRAKMSDNTILDKDKLKMENIIKEWEKILK